MIFEDVWIRTRRAAVSSGRATNLANFSINRKKMLVVIEKSESLRKIQKPAVALIKPSSVNFFVKIVAIYLMRQSL